MCFCAIGIYEGKEHENVGTLWRSAYLFNVDYIFTIGKRFKRQVTDTVKADLRIPYFEYTDWEHFLSIIPKQGNLVFIEQTAGAQTLPKVTHPDQAIYILGAEDHGIPKTLMRGHQKVEIPYAGKQSCNVAVAGSIVLYDRYIKSNSSKEN